MDTGKRMKERRKAEKLKAEEVAEALGCSRSTIFRYENGDIEKVPSSLIEPIAEILNTTPAYLMGWTDNPIDYDKLDTVYVPAEYKKLGMDVEEYIAFKKAEAEDAQRESAVAYFTDDEKSITALILNYNQLNEAGQNKVLEYIKDLAHNPNYQKEDTLKE